MRFFRNLFASLCLSWLQFRKFYREIFPTLGWGNCIVHHLLLSLLLPVLTLYVFVQTHQPALEALHMKNLYLSVAEDFPDDGLRISMQQGALSLSKEMPYEMKVPSYYQKMVDINNMFLHNTIGQEEPYILFQGRRTV